MDNFVFEILSLGRVHGPIDPIPPNFCSCPLGAFQNVKSGKVRIIHDLSYPLGDSVNSGINPEEYSVSYTSVDYMIDLIGQLPQPIYLASMDIKNAYLSCPVCQEDWHLLGF